MHGLHWASASATFHAEALPGLVVARASADRSYKLLTRLWSAPVSVSMQATSFSRRLLLIC